MTSYEDTDTARLCSFDTNEINDESLTHSEGDIFVLRHGERVDLVFDDWISKCFNKNGEYTRNDLNMPVTLPERENFPDSFAQDTPLTNVGLLQAKLTGEAFAVLDNITMKYVYCSPALRCVQTCHSFLTGLGISDKVCIRIEPGLFEWLRSEFPFPEFMTDDELIDAGYNIDITYEPMLTRDELKNLPEENADEYYTRNYEVVNRALQLANEHAEQGSSNILFVAHATSLDACTRQLIGFDPREVEKIPEIVQKIPYCSVVRVQKQCEKWQLQPSPVHSITHLKNDSFDYNILIDQ